MASLLTIPEVQAVLPSALDDRHLQEVVEREEAEIIKHYGAHYVDGSTPLIEVHPGGGKSLFLRRGITSVSEVQERLNVSDSPAIRASTDYFVWLEEGRLERLPVGAKWGLWVQVSYVPLDDRTQRKQVLLDLIRLALERQALQSESVAGEYSYSAPDWEEARAKLIRKLGFWKA